MSPSEHTLKTFCKTQNINNSAILFIHPLVHKSHKVTHKQSTRTTAYSRARPRLLLATPVQPARSAGLASPTSFTKPYPPDTSGSGSRPQRPTTILAKAVKLQRGAN